MVARITELSAAQSTVHYFERDGYYAKNDPEHRRASFWHGRAAAVLRLRGHVRPQRFEEVLAGYVPHTRLRLGRMRDGEHQHRPGLDITLSAPKSVSLEALVFGERRVVRAHDEAVRETLDWIEAELLQTRGYEPSTGRRPRVRAEGMVAAGFRHLTSRNQDPQLHTHSVLANMTRNADGEWRSLETTKLRRSEKLIGAYYRNALAKRLQALGYAISPTLVGRMPGFEIAGYDRALLDAFSGRRREILTWLEAHGLPYTPELTQMAALHTRRRKVDIGLAALIPKWRQRAHELGLARSASAARPPRPLDPETGRRSPRVRAEPPDLPANVWRNRRRAPALPDLAAGPAPDPSAPPETHSGAPATLSREPEVGVLEAVARAVAAIEERTAVFPETEVRALALGHAPGRYTLSEIDSAIAILVRDGDLVEAARRGADRAFVTDRAVRAERRILAMMREGAGQGRAFSHGALARLDQGSLTEGQRAAVDAIARAPDWLIGVQGHAGAGKTTMLRRAAALPGMPRVRGLAPSASAVRSLERGAGIETRTLQWFLTRFDDLSDPERLARGREAYAGTVLAIDEASMIGTVQMEALLRIAGKLGVARVVLIGDSRQLRAVDAGQPFRVLQRAGMATTVLDEVLRQREPTLAAAVAHARDGHPDLALRTLGERVHETGRETLGEAAGHVWLALPDEARAETMVLAPTHAIRREIHETIREGLALEGTLHGAALAIERLIDRRLTRAEASDIRSYAVGDTVVFHRDAYGCRRDDICTVARIGDDSVELAHPDGAPRRFRPSGNASRNLGVFDTASIEIRAGDRIRWTRNRAAPRARFGRPRAPDLVNGDTAGVLAIDSRRVRFVTEDGERISLARSDPQLRHLDHAYSSTVHAAQGKTARSVIAALDSARLSDQTLLYVEMSRASDEFVLLTDDREALAETLLRRPGREEGALEAIGEALLAPPVVEPEVFEKLRADWTAVEMRARAAGDIAYFTQGYPEVVARAAALTAIEDLPADMRRFTETLLAVHKQHRARERTVTGFIRRMQSHWRRWARLGRGSPDSPEEETPAHRDWRADGGRMLGNARAWLGGESGIAGHLDAMPGARTGLETAVRDLERVRTRDDYRVFERRWRAAQERAARDGVPAIDAEGYEEVAALGFTLGHTDALDDAARETVDEWKHAHDEAIGLRDAMEQFPAQVAALIEVRNNLELERDAEGGFDPDHSGYRAWRADAEDLLGWGRSMLPRYLPAHPERRARVVHEAAALEAALRADVYRTFGWLYRDVAARAERSGTIPFYTPRYDKLGLMVGAYRLAFPVGVFPETKRLVDAWREHDETCRRCRAEIERFPEDARNLLAADRTVERRRPDAEALLDAGRAMLADPEDYGPHFDAMPGARDRIGRALVPVHHAIQSGRAPVSPDAHFVLPCHDRVVPGDRIRWTMPRREYYLWDIEGDMPRLDCIVEEVEPAKRSSGERVGLHVEARSGESGPGPGEVVWMNMDDLFRHGCLRAEWIDEDERTRIEARARREAAVEERTRDRGEDLDWSM